MATTSERRRSSIKKEFNEKELQDLRTAFDMIDSNRDGRINSSDFKIMLTNLGINVKDEKIDELIRSASHTGNELIDENDFLSWVKKIQQLAPMPSNGHDEEANSEEILMEAFQVFDADNDGFITRDELRQAMEMIGETVTENQLTDFILMADTDQDGRISYEEFARLLQ